MKHEITELNKDSWPERLLEIPEPPKKLWIRGTMPGENHTFLSVVGSRKYTNYGKQVCEDLISGLSAYPIVIVSGLALGIDSIAHQAALDTGLKTIAIPGSGLSDTVLYPRMNLNLGRRILEAGGAMISEYEETRRAAPWMFPERNRIIVGISHAVLIIEAEQKSGTLITSRLATEYNRDVLTIPGSIFSPSSNGPHMLIKLGATPITSSKDLIEALGFDGSERQSLSLPSNLSAPETTLLNLLKEPKTKDQLILESNLPITKINEILTLLEIKSLITESAGYIYRKHS